MRFADDGVAVGAARSLLMEQGVPEDLPWRSTVVPDEEGGWVVRTWTRTPRSLPRPAGTPDYVHRVSSAMAVAQVHPLG